MPDSRRVVSSEGRTGDDDWSIDASLPADIGSRSASLDLDPETAWALTRALSPRDVVRVASIVERDGARDYHFDHDVSVDAGPPSTPWGVYLSGDSQRYDVLSFAFAASRGDAGYDALGLSMWLDDLRIDHLMSESAPTGDRHIWITLEEPMSADLVRDVAVLAAAVLPSLDASALLDPVHGFAIPPGAAVPFNGIARPLGSLTALSRPLSVAGLARMHDYLVEIGATDFTTTTPVLNRAATHATGPVEPRGPSTALSVDEAWRLTRSLARRGTVKRMIADSDGVIRSNRYPSFYSTNMPMPPSTPWCMELADAEGRFWLAGFDLDAKHAEDFEQAVEDLGVLVRVLRDASIPYVVCKSNPAPTGGFHVFVSLAGVPLNVMEQLADAAKAVLPSLDHGLLRNASTGAIRPPGAPHATGGQSVVMEGDPNALLSPTVTDRDLLRVIAGFRQLRPTVDPTLPTTTADDAWTPAPAGQDAPVRLRTHRPLPSWGAEVMAMPMGGRDPSRNGYLCLLAAAVAGWSFRDVEHASRTAPGMEHYRTRNNPSGGPRTARTRREAAARLERQWGLAQERALLYRHAPADSGRDLTALMELVDVIDGMLTAFRVSPGRWSGTEHAFTDSTVLTGLAWLSLRSGKRDVAAALRTIADTTGIPSSTVHRSLTRMKTAGLVACRKESDGPDAAVWRVQDVFSTPSDQVGPLHEMTARPPGQIFDARSRLLNELDDRVSTGRHDVFTRSALGPAARRVYSSLRTDHADAQLVAERAGMPVGRVRAQLRRLRRYSLATFRAGGWRRPVHDRRNQAARRLGTAGTLANRVMRHDRERELWAWWQNHLRRRAGRRGKNRAGPGQTLLFRFTDEYGGPEAYPSYPTGIDGSADHPTAWRYVLAGALQTLRDTELAA